MAQRVSSKALRAAAKDREYHEDRLRALERAELFHDLSIEDREERLRRRWGGLFADELVEIADDALELSDALHSWRRVARRR